MTHQRGTSKRLLGACLCVPFLLSGCATLLGFGGGEPGLRRAKGYRVVAPSSWKKRAAESSDHAFELPSGHVVTLTSSCDRDARAPLPILTRHLLMGTRDVQVVKRETRRVAGDEGLFSLVNATMDGRKFQLALFVVTMNSCIFDFSLISPTSIPEQEQQQFLRFAETLRYGKN